MACGGITAGAALVGYAGGRFSPATFVLGGDHGTVGKRPAGRALIDDATPVADHARFAWWRLARVVACGALLWALPVAGLAATLGWDHTLTRMAVFFTKAALLTFGGAYAVLPYVYQGAVERYGWVSPAQMIDGLALGETTPGPLIMVVAFVGFLGGYADPVFGRDATFLSGAAAAILVTWFTFLPSFVFILAGAPLVESTRGNLRLTAPLTGITAAVVGVIVNLALFFGYHVLWPDGRTGTFDGVAAALLAVSAWALFHWKQSVIRVIAASAVAGLLLSSFVAY